MTVFYCFVIFRCLFLSKKYKINLVFKSVIDTERKTRFVWGEKDIWSTIIYLFLDE